MSNLSRKDVENLLSQMTKVALISEVINLRNKVKEMESFAEEQEGRINELEEDVEELEDETSEAQAELDRLETEIAHSSHEVFGEEVTIMSNRIDIGHFFETLAEVSKNYTPYQLEDILKKIKL